MTILGMDQNVLILMALAMVMVGGLAYAFLFNSIENEKRTDARLNAIGGDRKVARVKSAKKLDDASRRKQREAALNTLADQREAAASAKNPPLHVRLKQAGMEVPVPVFYMIGLALALLGGGGTFVIGLPWFVSLGVAFVLGFGLPNLVVNMKRKKRINAFIKEFPNAVEVIIRGIKSGLPLNDCMRIIAKDAQEPVKGEFQALVESQQVGLSMPQACQRMAEAIPSAETSFFAIVISIQAQAGGNLGEALQNLANVLRERAKMKDKIVAISSEAKASAYIIGALPFIVAVLVNFSSPGYLNLLWEDETGHMVLGCCLLSYSAGIFVMKKMINFDF